MPAKGYRKSSAKKEKVQFRLKPEQKAAYAEAAERSGYRTISQWARALLNAAAGLGTKT